MGTFIRFRSAAISHKLCNENCIAYSCKKVQNLSNGCCNANIFFFLRFSLRQKPAVSHLVQTQNFECVLQIFEIDFFTFYSLHTSPHIASRNVAVTPLENTGTFTTHFRNFFFQLQCVSFNFDSSVSTPLIDTRGI